MLNNKVLLSEYGCRYLLYLPKRGLKALFCGARVHRHPNERLPSYRGRNYQYFLPLVDLPKKLLVEPLHLALRARLKSKADKRVVVFGEQLEPFIGGNIPLDVFGESDRIPNMRLHSLKPVVLGKEMELEEASARRIPQLYLR